MKARQVVFLTSLLNAGAADCNSGATMKKYKFKATIQPGIGGGAGIVFPYDVEREFGTTARVPVKATLDGVPYSGSLIKCGAAEHMLGAVKAIREKIGKGPGEIIEVVVWKDEDERTIDVAAEFKRLMKDEEGGLACDL
jgi:hypothetical protein